MRFIDSSAKTVEEAITQGLEKLDCSVGDVTVDILSEGSKGFLGILGSKPAVVRLTLRDDNDKDDILSVFSEEGNGKAAAKGKGKKKEIKVKAEPAKPKIREKGRAPKAEKKPFSQATPVAGKVITPAPLCNADAPEGKAQQFLMKMSELMGVSVSVSVRRDEEGNVRADMQGDTLGILIGRRGETLDALQYLTSLHVNRGREEYVRVTLDNENYRAKREEALTRLANRMASRAVKTGRKVVMEPMNPYERRILHSALQQNGAVATHSEGDEPNRHVVITLKAEQ